MKKIIFFTLIFSCFFVSCQKKLAPEDIERLEKEKSESQKKEIEIKKKEAVQNYINLLSEYEKISQLFLVNIEGNSKYANVEVTPDGVPLVPGGCLLFSYNIGKTPEQIYDFTKSIHDFYLENNSVPPYIAIDQEGGDVNRLRGITSTFGSQKLIADYFPAPKAETVYENQAKQLALLGINMNLAPVIEIENSKNKEFLGTRTFGNAEKVLKYGQMEVFNFEKEGVATVLKHFPGNSSTDPHSGLPEIRLTKSELEEYLVPFEKLLPFSSALLMSHARISVSDDEGYNKDSKIPGCLSRFWVTEIVRSKFGFDGIIFSDDIFMAALASNGFTPEIAAIQAIEAGIDVIMLSEKRFGSVAQILLKKANEDSVFATKINEAVTHVIEYKIKSGLLRLVESFDDNHISFYLEANPQKKEFDKSEFTQSYNSGMEVLK